jgi:saccharopine dehydrogenase-like NADP-dependent oxidoreductase
VRVLAVGQKQDRPAEALVEMIDYYDASTGFTAMERTTGWHGSMVAIMNAHGQTPRGVNPVETAVPADLLVEEMARREIIITATVNAPMGRT